MNSALSRSADCAGPADTVADDAVDSVVVVVVTAVAEDALQTTEDDTDVVTGIMFVADMVDDVESCSGKRSLSPAWSPNQRQAPTHSRLQTGEAISELNRDFDSRYVPPRPSCLPRFAMRANSAASLSLSAAPEKSTLPPEQPQHANTPWSATTLLVPDTFVQRSKQGCDSPTKHLLCGGRERALTGLDAQHRELSVNHLLEQPWQLRWSNNTPNHANTINVLGQLPSVPALLHLRVRGEPSDPTDTYRCERRRCW